VIKLRLSSSENQSDGLVGLLDLTDVCPLLTKQYIQVELQIQQMLYNFLMFSLPMHGMVKSFWSFDLWASALINNRHKSIAH
jgi:hypothetical protein